MLFFYRRRIVIKKNHARNVELRARKVEFCEKLTFHVRVNIIFNLARCGLMKSAVDISRYTKRTAYNNVIIMCNVLLNI